MVSSVPDNVINKSLCKKIKVKANEKYGKKTGAYKSMYIVAEYKKAGGKYKGGVKNSNGTIRWNKEKWIQVTLFITSGKKIPCGSGKNKKACRPTRKLKGTPITLKESVNKHGKDKVLALAKTKKKNMKRRISWNKGK